MLETGPCAYSPSSVEAPTSFPGPVAGQSRKQLSAKERQYDALILRGSASFEKKTGHGAHLPNHQVPSVDRSTHSAGSTPAPPGCSPPCYTHERLCKVSALPSRTILPLTPRQLHSINPRRVLSVFFFVQLTDCGGCCECPAFTPPRIQHLSGVIEET